MNPIKEMPGDLKLLIFDIDGVLVDVTNSYRTAIKQTVEHFYQCETSFEDIQELKNESGFNNDWDLTQELLKRRGISLEREIIVKQFQSIYWGNNGTGLILNENWLLDKKLLQTLSKRYKLAIFTGRPRQEALFVLDHNDVSQYFNPIIAMEDVSKGKPDPEGLNTILAKLSIQPSQACYFGDTFDDVRSSKRAGIFAVGVLAPPHDMALVPMFESEGAGLVLHRINEIQATNLI